MYVTDAAGTFVIASGLLVVVVSPRGCPQWSRCGTEVLQYISKVSHMALLTLNSWNVQGMNSKVKRALVFKFLKQYSPDICIFQETHLIGGRVLSLRKPWVGHCYHATHSTHARGVSILM